MNLRIASGLAAITLSLTIALNLNWEKPLMAADANAGGPMVAHNVYFALKDNSPEARQKLVDACKKYLTDHPGEVYFAAGVLSDLHREVNDRDYDVGLHVFFKNMAAHDAYQTAARHLKFIEENKENWKKVRVFDDDCEGTAK